MAPARAAVLSQGPAAHHLGRWLGVHQRGASQSWAGTCGSSSRGTRSPQLEMPPEATARHRRLCPGWWPSGCCWSWEKGRRLGSGGDFMEALTLWVQQGLGGEGVAGHQLAEL